VVSHSCSAFISPRPFVALDGEALAAGGEDRVEQFGRAADENALGVGRLVGRGHALDQLVRRVAVGIGVGLLHRRAGLERYQPGLRAIGHGLLGGERMQLARLGREQELVIDDVPVSHAAPQPLQDVIAVLADLAGPGRLRIAGLQPGGGALERSARPTS
jgi:hypothetical protein